MREKGQGFMYSVKEPVTNGTPLYMKQTFYHQRRRRIISLQTLTSIIAALLTIFFLLRFIVFNQTLKEREGVCERNERVSSEIHTF